MQLLAQVIVQMAPMMDADGAALVFAKPHPKPKKIDLEFTLRRVFGKQSFR